MEAIVQDARGNGAVLDADMSFVKREVTILLADLRGFTAITATHPAGVVITLLNRCLARMSEIIVSHQGTIDKFMGDSIMVLFGAPIEHVDDVERALACAVEMQLAMRELNSRYKQDGFPELFMGIGINTGTVMAGKFGSDVYSEYTVIGNEVNLASRIEAFSLRGQVLISQATFERCDGFASVGDCMEVLMKGKATPIILRELLSIPSRNLEVPRQEIRRSHRVEVKLPCSFYHIENKIVRPFPSLGIVRDIGYHGILLETDAPIKPMDELKLEFELALVDYMAANIYAKVVNIKLIAGRQCAGLEFTSVDAETNMKIQLFVQYLVAAE
jgi:adenylate cyclase